MIWFSEGAGGGMCTCLTHAVHVHHFTSGKFAYHPFPKTFLYLKKSVQYILQLHLGFFSRLNNGLVVVSFTIPALIGPAHSLAIGSEDRGSRIQKVRGHLDKVEVRSESM